MSRWEEFEKENLEEKKNVVEVPFVRAHRGCNSIVVNTPNRWGYGLKIAIRQVAKRLPEYHLRIKNPDPEVCCGRDQSGNKIPIDTLGRWAFGVPGYMGHLVFEGGRKDKIIIYIPPGSPPELIALIEKATKLL